MSEFEKFVNSQCEFPGDKQQPGGGTVGDPLIDATGAFWKAMERVKNKKCLVLVLDMDNDGIMVSPENPDLKRDLVRKVKEWMIRMGG